MSTETEQLSDVQVVAMYAKTYGSDQVWEAACRLLAAASPEPSEPPPGVYRDEEGSIFIGQAVRNGVTRWYLGAPLATEWMLWDQTQHLVEGRLERLFSRDELIPDPKDADALTRLQLDSGHQATQLAIRQILHVLRARAEALQAEGGSDRG